LSTIQQLIDLNRHHSELFTSAALTLERRCYRGSHPTEIGVLKCMDGRLNLPVMTKTALGIIQPWRNIAGRFDLGWIAFQQSVGAWVEYAGRRGRNCLVLVTYHYSRGDKHRGCAGFNYDTEQALKFTKKLTADFREVFGNSVVHTIQVGVETDLDALILHGEHGEIVDLSTVCDSTLDNILNLLHGLYPSMPRQTLHDFAPLVIGNIAHIAEIRADKRQLVDTQHREHVIAVGRGFDWLHELNLAIIVGPFDPDLRSAIVTAGKIVWSNINEGRVDPSEGVVLMASAAFRDQAGPEPLLAEKKARFLLGFALDALTASVPQIMPHLKHLAVRLNMHTRLMDVLAQSE
jgi:hypothetical protein